MTIRLDLLPIGKPRIDADLLKRLVDSLADLTGARVKLLDAVDGPESRDQPVASADLLDLVIDRWADSAADYCLGVTACDLYGVDRPYVFGEAEVGGNCALVGVARFGVAEKPGERFFPRLLTEAIHETGHLAGLLHCDQSACAMRASRTVDDVDAKGSVFCDRCADSFCLQRSLDRRGGHR